MTDKRFLKYQKGHRLGIIVNPFSGRFRNRRLSIADIDRVVGDDAIILTSSSDEFAVDLVKSLVESGCSLIGVAGGDGTLFSILNAYINNFGEDTEMPVIFPLKSGTINIVADAIGYSGDTIDILKCVINRIHSTEGLALLSKRVLKVKISYRETPLYCFVLSGGIIYRFIYSYYARSNPTKIKAFYSTIKDILSFFSSSKDAKEFWRSEQIEISVDGSEFKRDNFLVLILSAISKMPLWFNPFSSVGEEESGIRLLYNTMSAKKAIFSLLRHIRGEIPPSEEHICRLCQQVDLKLSGGIVIDGEIFNIYGDTTINVTVGPKIYMPDLRYTRKRK